MLIAIGVIVVVASSLYGLVIFPQRQLAGMEPVVLTTADGSRVQVPQDLESWQESPGRKVYESLGCVYCHSQQVRPEGFGSDIDRGWGARRSVPRDYVLAPNPLLGTMRTGPDLANIGARQPSREWHFLHLFDPQLTSPGSVMPPMPFLFEVMDREPNWAGADEVLLPKPVNGKPAWIVPSRRAQELVAYLRSLNQRGTLEDVQ
jgi:cytochrome c oxidase cbb3-type subunit 2